MTTRRRRSRWALTIAILVAFAALLLGRRSHPTPEFLYLIDSGGAPHLSAAIGNLTPERDRAEREVVVRVIAPPPLFSSVTELLQQLEANQEDSASLASSRRSQEGTRVERSALDYPVSDLYFVRLGAPVRDTKKHFRQTVEQSAALHGLARAEALRRIVPLIPSTDYAGPKGCQTLRHDFAYMQWSFFAMAMTLDDSTVALLKRCGTLE